MAMVRRVNGLDIRNINDVMDAVSRGWSSNFFSRETMRFWKSRVNSKVYGGRYFVTSEQDFSGVRKYTIRELTDNGGVNTIAFQRYGNRQDAHKVAKFLGTLGY